MSREQFEAWYLENWGHTEDNHESLFERCQDGCGDEYYRLGVRMAYEAWQAASKASEQQLAAVVAENAGMKSAVVRIFNYGYQHGHESTVEGNYVDIHRNDISEYHEDIVAEIAEEQTPATDAYLAEVRAQGVDMFALMFAEEAIKSNNITTGWRAKASREASEYAEALREDAAQLRQGAAL